MTHLGPYPLDSIITGDARELAKAMPDESVDLIFTDPPYPKKYMSAFSTLASCAHSLKRGGRLLSLVGHYQLPEAMNELGSVLTYDWIIANAAPGRTAAMFQKRVWATWKPCLVYRRGTLGNRCNFANDLFTVDKDAFNYAKMFHSWGQGASFFAYYIDRWTLPGDVVLDPFCGGGTTAAVCKALDRRCVSFEIDPDTAERARQRVLTTQAPLVFPEPEQLTMEV